MNTTMALLIAVFVAMLTGPLSYADTAISLYSGPNEGEHPAPVYVGKVSRDDVMLVRIPQASALVNYPAPDAPVIVERVQTVESGARVSCPYYMRLDGSPAGLRVDTSYTTAIRHKVFCDTGGCTDALGTPLSPATLLFGKYNLPKCVLGDGSDYGFGENVWVSKPAKDCLPGEVCGPEITVEKICCPEFTVERTFTELHYFDNILILDNFREQKITDLDVDLRRLYLTFVGDQDERVNCPISSLLETGDRIRVADHSDCTLPAGSSFSLYAQSRFFHQETRACGRFVAKGVKTPNGFSPDWFLGWYDCDGRRGRTPIVKQYRYPTRVDLIFTNAKLINGGLE